MAIWLWHGIAVYGYLALWLHDCIAIWLDGYVAIQLWHGTGSDKVYQVTKVTS